MNTIPQMKKLLLASLAFGLLFAAESGVAKTDDGENVLKRRNYNSRLGTFSRLPRIPKIGKKEKWDGYLYDVGPVNLRFSDEKATEKRPPSPALPEFTMLSNEYDPYLLEMPLPEDEIASRELLAEVTIEMDPHVVVSGMIDTRSYEREVDIDRLDLEEESRKVLRPEEVLIFFEAESKNSDKTIVLPFSPAIPNSSPDPIPSRATINRE